MRIGKPKVSKMNTGSASAGAFGNGRAKTVGEIKSAHHFFAVNGGGQTPNFSRGNASVNSSATDKRKAAKKMF
jgi:hypothetical protein